MGDMAHGFRVQGVDVWVRRFRLLLTRHPAGAQHMSGQVVTRYAAGQMPVTTSSSVPFLC